MPDPVKARASQAGSLSRRRRKLMLDRLAARLELCESGNQPIIPTISIEMGEIQFSGQRLLRVRAQLTALDAAIAEEVRHKTADGQRLNWLVQAQDRLADQEAKLSARDKPAKEERLTRAEQREQSRDRVDVG